MERDCNAWGFGAPRGATARRDRRGESGGREIDDADSTRGEKSYRENGVLSTTIKTNLRQIVLERDSDFFERNAAAAASNGGTSGAAPALVGARGVYVPRVVYVTRTNCTNFPHNPLLFLRTVRPAALNAQILSSFEHACSYFNP